MRRILQKIITWHWLTTLLLMGAFSLLGAMASYNLFVMFAANFQFLHEHGVMAVMEGALLQLGDLLGSGFFGLLMYLGFKACERVLVEKILEK
jgi:hypothetical protein